MPLLAPPPECAPLVAEGVDAPTLRASIERALASVEEAVLIDLNLGGAGAGAVWFAELTFSKDVPQATVSVDPATVRVAVVTAPTRAELERQMGAAVSALETAGALWIPHMRIVGAGAGAVWLGVVLGSTSPRPLAPGGGGDAFLHPSRVDCSVNSGRVDGPYSDFPILHCQSGGHVAGGYNGGGVGNKAILGFGAAGPVLLSAWTGLEYTWLDLNPLEPGLAVYANVLLDIHGDGSKFKIGVVDPLSLPVLLNGTTITNGDGSKTTSFNAATENLLIVNGLTDPDPPGVVFVPPDVGPGFPPASGWPGNSYMISTILAHYPACRIIGGDSLDGGLPKAPNVTPAFLLITGDSGNQHIRADRLSNVLFDGVAV